MVLLEIELEAARQLEPVDGVVRLESRQEKMQTNKVDFPKTLLLNQALQETVVGKKKSNSSTPD